MFVAEAPGANEEMKGIPLVGESGKEFDKILTEIGVRREEVFITNVSKYRPFQNDIRRFFRDGFSPSGKSTGKMSDPGPEIRDGIRELQAEIQSVKPNVIVAFGNVSLWALLNRPSAKSGIGDWRGSELQIADRLATMEEPVGHSCAVIPTYHPAAVLRNWEWRPLVVHDLRTRALKYADCPVVEQPRYRFIVRPTFQQVYQFIRAAIMALDHGAISRVAVDIETKHKFGLISCIGLGVSKTDAICIPLTTISNPEGYWAPEEEAAIYMLLQELLTHPRIKIAGQNFLYDAQYFAKEMGFRPNVRDDTMFMQHVCYAGMDKGLDFLSSMYCRYHRFWKHEGKEFGNYKTPQQEEEGWVYNCKDCVITFEVAEVLDGVLDKLNLREQYNFQMELWYHVFDMMLRGVRIDLAARKVLGEELARAIGERLREIEFIVGHPFNPNSPKQMQALFYGDLKFPVQYSKKKNADGTRSPTLDENALEALVRKEPLFRDFVRLILEKRSLGVFLSTFVQARLGSDNRMRCYFNPAGTETFRFSSSEDAFGSGTNLQNIPRGLEDEEKVDPNEIKQYITPNIRKLFRPDHDYTIGEADQAGADAQVVAWDSGDEILKQIFREGKKLHVENGKMMYPELMRGNPKREPYYTRVKVGCHATNYGAMAKTVASALGISVHEADQFQKRWFDIHPQIKEWHRRVEAQLSGLYEVAPGIRHPARQVFNPFGYRRFYFDRIEEVLPEALAWVPQSTVALVTNQGLVNTSPRRIINQPLFTDRFIDPESEAIRTQLHALGFMVLLQVHDSIVFQYPTRVEHIVLPLLRRALAIRIPFDDPLIIPWGLKTSTRSWGDCEERDWPEPTPLLLAA